MDDFESLFYQLRQSIRTCHATFIAKFIPPGFHQKPDDYEPSVRAYCVLSFAALEYYFECVALLLADEAVRRWQKNQSHSDIALRLAFLYPDTKFAEAFPKEPREQQTAHDRLLNALTNFENFIANRNHSINSVVFKKLFWPVGISSVGTPGQFISLETLRSERGKHAHTMESRTIAPEAAANLVHDCLELGREIQEAASRLLYGQSKAEQMRKLSELLQVRLCILRDSRKTLD